MSMDTEDSSSSTLNCGVSQISFVLYYSNLALDPVSYILEKAICFTNTLFDGRHSRFHQTIQNTLSNTRPNITKSEHSVKALPLLNSLEDIDLPSITPEKAREFVEGTSKLHPIIPTESLIDIMVKYILQNSLTSLPRIFWIKTLSS